MEAPDQERCRTSLRRDSDSVERGKVCGTGVLMHLEGVHFELLERFEYRPEEQC